MGLVASGVAILAALLAAGAAGEQPPDRWGRRFDLGRALIVFGVTLGGCYAAATLAN